MLLAVWLVTRVVQPLSSAPTGGGLSESTSAWLMQTWLSKVRAAGMLMPIAFIWAAASGGIAVLMSMVVAVFQSPAWP
jgi:hypothetical protein